MKLGEVIHFGASIKNQLIATTAIAAVGLAAGAVVGVRRSEPVLFDTELKIDPSIVNVSSIEGIDWLCVAKATADVTSKTSLVYKLNNTPDFLNGVTTSNVSVTYNPNRAPASIYMCLKNGKITREVRPKVPLQADRTPEQKADDIPKRVTLTIPNDAFTEVIQEPLLPRRGYPEYAEQISGVLMIPQIYDPILRALPNDSKFRIQGGNWSDLLLNPVREVAKTQALKSLGQCSQELTSAPGLMTITADALKKHELDIIKAYPSEATDGITVDDFDVQFADPNNSTVSEIQIPGLTEANADIAELESVMSQQGQTRENKTDETGSITCNVTAGMVSLSGMKQNGVGK